MYAVCLIVTSVALGLGRYVLAVDISLAGKFSRVGLIDSAEFNTNVASKVWLELYDFPIANAGGLVSPDEAKAKHRWTVTAGSPATVQRTTVYRNGGCFPSVDGCEINTNIIFYVYTGDPESPNSADLFFSSDSTEFVWWLRCDEASAILEEVCTSGRIKLLVRDTRTNDNGVVTTFIDPPFISWETSLTAFTGLTFSSTPPMKLTWKAADECIFP